MGERGVQELYIFLVMVCILPASARCFSGHMANDNPVHSLLSRLTHGPVWCCAVPADITHSRSILFHTVFSFFFWLLLPHDQERVGPGRFFSNACTPSSHLFFYFCYTLTLQSSPPRYMWLLIPTHSPGSGLPGTSAKK